MKFSTFAALAAATFFAVASIGVTEAHGPTRQKISETIEINAPPDKVWAVIGNFQDFSWHPAVVKTEGKGGNAVDATRTVTLQGGGTIDEVIAKYEPQNFTLMYRINAVDVKVLPVTNYSSWLIVTPLEDGKRSKVEWRGAFYRGYPNNDPPPELNDEAAIKAVTAVYKAGLEGLKKKVEGGS